MKNDPAFKARRSAKKKADYQARGEQLKERAREYFLSMSEEERALYRAKQRARYRLNAERRIKLAAEWAKANPSKRAAIRRRWWDKNPESRKVHKHRRRVRETTVLRTLTVAEWKAILAVSPKCFYCRRSFASWCKPTMDHKIPLSRGGAHSKENVVAACARCNSSKGARIGWSPLSRA